MGYSLITRILGGVNMDFKLNDYHRDILDEELLADVKRVSQKLSKNTLTQREYKNAGGKFSPATFRNHFGSWSSVLKLCGLIVNNYQLAASHGNHTHNKKVNDKELLENIKPVAIYLGVKSISPKEYAEHGDFSLSLCFRRYKSWNNILNAAGPEPYKRVSEKRLNDEDMLKEIERIWIKLGRQPTSSDIKNGVSKYSLHAYAEHFGGWRGALNAFIKYIYNDTPNDDINKNHENAITAENQEQLHNTIPHKTSRDVNLRLRFKVMQRDIFKCCICGASPATNPSIELHIDHIVPWAKGGETVIENLQTLCSNCNLGKSDLT